MLHNISFRIRNNEKCFSRQDPTQNLISDTVWQNILPSSLRCYEWGELYFTTAFHLFNLIKSWRDKSKLVSLYECKFIFYPYIDSPQNSRVHRGNLITIGWGEEHNNIGPILTSTQYSVYPPCSNSIFSMILHHARTSGDVGTFRHVKIVVFSCGRHHCSIAIFLHWKYFGRYYWFIQSMTTVSKTTVSNGVC